MHIWSQEKNMNFTDFAEIYSRLRIRSNRANDLFVDAIECSDIEEHVEANDDEEFELRMDKTHGIAWVELHNPRRGVILHASANLTARTVDLRHQSVDTIAILDMFENENLNGLETMARYNEKFPRENPLDEHEEERSYAAKAARMIVAGIGDTPAMTPEQQTLVANEIIAILKDPAPFGFAARVQRVLAWTLDPATQPEWSLYVAAWVIRNVNDVDYIDEAPLRDLFDRYPALTSMSPT
jgi:hypothetical protein